MTTNCQFAMAEEMINLRSHNKKEEENRIDGDGIFGILGKRQPQSYMLTQEEALGRKHLFAVSFSSATCQKSENTPSLYFAYKESCNYDFFLSAFLSIMATKGNVYPPTLLYLLFFSFLFFFSLVYGSNIILF